MKTIKTNICLKSFEIKIMSLFYANLIYTCIYTYIGRYLLGFMCYLVEIGLFKKIKISFLMVGHTHEDVDQVFSKLGFNQDVYGKIVLESLSASLYFFCFYVRFFSIWFRFSHWLNRHAAMTLDKLMNGFEACFTPRPHSVKTNR